MNKSSPTPTSLITVLHDTKEWNTRIDGEIGEIRVDGKELMQIHDLAKNVDKQNKQIRVLAIIATIMAFVVLFIMSSLAIWLLSHESAIERVLLTGNRDFDIMSDHANKWSSHQRQRAWVHLKHHQGLDWDIGKQDWVKPPLPPPPLKPSPIGGANHLDLKWAGR